MKRTRLPEGKYNARVTKRQNHAAESGRACVELTFEVTTPRFAGHTVSGRFYDHVRINRARSLSRDQAVGISVTSRRNHRGRQFPTVRDFQPVGQPTVVMYVNGVCAHKPKRPDAPRTVFGPVGVFTEDDLMTVERERLEWRRDGFELPPTPLLDSGTFTAINRAIADEHEPRNVLPEPVDEPPFGKEYRWSMQVVGGKRGNRTLWDADAMFARYARAGGDLRLDIPAHLSVFQYSDDLVQYKSADRNGSVAGYRGMVWARRFVIDLDDHDGATLRLDTCRNVVTALGRLGLTSEQILVFFSGNAGMHVMFPTMIAGTVPQTNYEYACGHVCQMLVDQAARLLAPPSPPPMRRNSGVFDSYNELAAGAAAEARGSQPRYDPRSELGWHEPIDWNMYRPNAILRAPNTRHEKSGLYKIRLTIEELLTLEAEAIRRLAVSPRPFEPPRWVTAGNECLNDFWQYATAVADSRPYAMSGAVDKNRWVFADTFDFMHNGAPEGTRSTRVFRAAVNLLQVGCSRGAVYQLLSPAAYMSGMPPRDVRHQLEGAIRYLQKTRWVRRDSGVVPPFDEEPREQPPGLNQVGPD